MPRVRKNAHFPPAPRAGELVWKQWQNEGRIRAIAALACNGGLMAGTQLAHVVGISARGLRQYLVKDDLIRVEIRARDDGVGSTWYRLNMPPCPEPPPLLSGSTTMPRLN